MQYSSIVVIASYVIANVLAHGVVEAVKGANGVDMPGLTVIDGTPRDCASARCGSQADTAIIRNRELGTNRASALGRTTGGGPVVASEMIGLFMSSGSGNKTAGKRAREIHATNLKRRSLAVRAANGGSKTPKGTKETGVAAATGAGASSGLPTAADDGTVKMTFHQVNQDGAGPLTAMVDGTSGGKDKAAFQKATVTKNVPGIGIGGLSAATVMDFPLEVKMPAGMTCDATVAAAENVCVMKVQNKAGAGPFGGSVAFTQSSAARKRAIEYKLRKRNFARALNQERQQEDVSTILATLEESHSASDAVDEKDDIKLTKRQQEEVSAIVAALEASHSGLEDSD